MVKKNIPLFIVLLLSIISARALLHPGFPPTHDGEYHIIRFYEFDQALREGNWYPRWAKDLQFGYGVPLFNFVYPLPNYIASFFHVLGLSFIDAFKASMVAASLASGVFMYLWAKKWWGVLGGIVAAWVYIFSPYRLLDIYVRGSVGEVWALALFPAFLWTITEYASTQKKKFFLLSAVFFAFTVFSHNILALMFVPFVCTYILLVKFLYKRRLISLLIPIVSGICLSSIFWVPALLENKDVVGLEIFIVAKHFPDLFQLLIPSWGTGFSGMILQNQMSFQLGVMNILMILFSVIFLFFLRSNKQRREKYIVIFSLVWFFIILFLMLPYSKIVWETVPFMNYFQFPWRLLSLSILISSFLAGVVFIFFQKRRKLSIIIAGSIILLSYILIASYATFAYYHNRDDSYYTSRSNFIDGTNSPGNVFNTRWAKNITRRDQVVQFSKEQGRFEILQSKTSHREVLVFSPIDQVLSFAITYFPGWTVYVDGKKANTKIGKKGEIILPISKGPHVIRAQFETTAPRTLGLAATLISFGLFLILLHDKIYKRIQSL